MGRMRRERGAVLGAAIMAAFLASIFSYLILQIAISQARQARFHEGHVTARHAAEAGIVLAYERLTREVLDGTPYCGGPLTVEGLTVNVTVAPCAGWPRTVSAQVTY
ncbi:MAG: hypothetical protein HYZ96_02780 [Candidatus Omnitrophica bacterium]|nr:hypothetical protein [Candidatus Omnitrophota bacterium]